MQVLGFINVFFKLLEFPMKEEFKFIIIVPNENDVLQILFRKLTNEGLASAIRSIQPVFIASSESNAPRIKIGSETLLKEVGIYLDCYCWVRSTVVLYRRIVLYWLG